MIGGKEKKIISLLLILLNFNLLKFNWFIKQIKFNNLLKL